MRTNNRLLFLVIEIVLLLEIVVLFSACSGPLAFDDFAYETGYVNSKGEMMIRLDSNGGSLTKDSVTVKTNSDYSVLYEAETMPIRSGYTFVGWYTESGIKIEANEKVWEIHKAVAQWIPIENAKRIGGTIYYIDSFNDNVYRFYDRDGVLIGENITDISLLSNAVWYTKEGTSDTDMYYVVWNDVLGYCEFNTSMGPQYDNSTLKGQGKIITKKLLTTRYAGSNDLISFIRNFNEEMTSEYNPSDWYPSDWYIGSEGDYSAITDEKASPLYLNLFKDNNVLTVSLGYSRERQRYYTIVWYGNANTWRTNEVVSNNPFSYGDFLGYCSGRVVPIRSF